MRKIGAGNNCLMARTLFERYFTLFGLYKNNNYYNEYNYVNHLYI